MKKKYFSTIILLIPLYFAFGQITPGNNNILYVNTNFSGGNGSGDSWANAIKELADALKWAGQNKNNSLWSNTNPLQLWIANGTYKPKYSPIDGDNYRDNPTDPRDKTFLMVKDVKLYGGFIGNETDISQRNFSNGNKTILTGDFNGDDVISGYGSTLNITKNTENAYHVVLISANGYMSTNIDGLLISGANKSDVDYTNSFNDSYVKVNNVNIYRTKGGGIINYARGNYSDINLKNSSIVENYTGIYTEYANIINVTNSSINRNNNGGIVNTFPGPSEITIKNSLLSGNLSASISTGSSSYTRVTILNSLFSENHSNTGAGAISLSAYTGSISIINSTFAGNTGPLCISAYSSRGASMISYNSIVYGNAGGVYIAKLNAQQDNTLFMNSLIQGESSTANNNLNGNLFYTNFYTDYANKDYTLANGSPAVDKGDNALYTSNGGNILTDKDLLGNTRVYNYANGGRIDMGAYESNYTNMAVTDLDKNKINLYPNFTNGIFYVETQSAEKSELYNIMGQFIKTVDLKSGKNQIDITKLSSGVYILKLDSKSFKIIKK